MPTTRTIRLPDITDDEQRLVHRLLDQLEQKARRNRTRSAYYDMHKVTRLIGSVIPPQYARAGIVLGWSGKAVNILSRRTNLDGFTWADGDLDSIGYREVWDGNNLDSEIDQALVSSLIHGVAFAVNTLGDESLDEPVGLIHFKTAFEATGDWNARARRLDNLLSIVTRDTQGNPTELALYLYGETITAERDTWGRWTTDRQPHPWGMPAEPLPYQPRLGRALGSSRISRAVMSLQDEATRTCFRLAAHSDIYAIPDLWMLGADASVFKNVDGSLKDSWQIVMGRIKGLPDDEGAENPRADVKQFPATSPQPHLDNLKQQAQLFAGETSIPLTSLGVSDMTNPTSADSYLASREDLISEAEGATDDWSSPLRRSFTRALAMSNGIKLADVPASWQSIDSQWRSPMHLSRAAAADAGVKQLTAVPWLAETTVGLELLGLSKQQIERATGERARAAGSSALDTILRRAAEQNLTSNGSSDTGEPS